MTRIPQIRPTTMRRILLRLGFAERPGRGSHRVFVHPDGRRTVVASHAKPLTLGTFRAILKQIEYSVDDFLKLL